MKTLSIRQIIKILVLVLALGLLAKLAFASGWSPWAQNPCSYSSPWQQWGYGPGLPNNLVAHYFAGRPVSGTTVYDEVPGRDHSRAASEGHAWDFDSAGDKITVAYASAFRIAGRDATGFTVSAWVHPMDDAIEADVGGRVISRTLNTSSTSGNGFDLLLYDAQGTWGAGGTCAVWFVVKCDGTNAEYRTANTALPLAHDPPWNHITAVYNANGDRKIQIYIDGVLDTAPDVDIAGGGNISDDVNIPTYIGNSFNGVRTFSHKIFDVRMWGAALTAGQIANLHDFANVAPGNLMAWWKADEGSGTRAFDCSGNGRNGILSGVTQNTQIQYSFADKEGYCLKAGDTTFYPVLASENGFYTTACTTRYYGQVAYDATLSDATLDGLTYWPDGSSVTLTLPRAPEVVQIDVTNGPKFFTAWPNYVQVAAGYSDITNTAGHIFTRIDTQGKKNILLYKDDLNVRQRDAIYQCTRTATSVAPTPVPSHILLNLPLETDLVDTISSVAADLTRNNEATYTADADSLVYTVAANTGRISSAGGTVTGLVLEAEEKNWVPQSDSLLTGGTDYFVTASYGEADTPFPGKTSGIITDNGIPNVHIKMCFGTSATPGERYSLSCFVKDIDRGYASVGAVFFLGAAPISAPYVSINLSTQAMSLGDAYVVQNPDQATYDTMGNGWYRVRVWGSVPAGVNAIAPFIGTSSAGGIAYVGTGESIRYFGLEYKASPFQTNYISAGVPTTSAQEVASIAASAAVQTAISAGDGTAMATFTSASNAIDLTPNYFINFINNNELGSAGMLGLRVTNTTATIEASGGSATATVAVAAAVGATGGDIEYNEAVMAAVQWEASATRMRVGYRKIADAGWTWGAWAATVGAIFPVNSGALLYFGGGEAGTNDISLVGVQNIIMRDDVLSDAEMDSTYTF